MVSGDIQKSLQREEAFEVLHASLVENGPKVSLCRFGVERFALLGSNFF